MILWFYLFFLCSVFWVVVVFIYIVYFGYCVGSVGACLYIFLTYEPSLNTLLKLLFYV